MQMQKIETGAKSQHLSKSARAFACFLIESEQEYEHELLHLDVVRRLTPAKNENQEIHNTPTCTPRLEHPNLTTPT
jgi:hypothetical protein